MTTITSYTPVIPGPKRRTQTEINERLVFNRLIQLATAAGFTLVRVSDGEESHATTDASEAWDTINSTGEGAVMFKRAADASGAASGSASFITNNGNHGWDVMCDNSCGNAEWAAICDAVTEFANARA